MKRGPKPRRRPDPRPAAPPSPPAGLTVAQRNVFRTVVRWLEPQLRPEDAHVIEQYARAICRYRDLCAEEQAALQNGQKPNYKTISLISQARAEMETASSRLGMSPRDRAKIRMAAAGPGKEEDQSILRQLLAERDN